MLHNHSLVSAPCHMIAVMTDDGLTRRNVCVAMVELRWNSEHSKSSTTMRVQFNEVISYAAKKLEIECFKQTPMVSCADNRESDVFIRNVHTTEFDSLSEMPLPFLQAFLCFSLATDTTLVHAWLGQALSMVHHLPT